ncbi:AKR_HP2_G0023560.mRNA.1.CDS.1 [Saccharomyces cerevisiae]|nr:AKR_HP2_G0023560.mRNA.1.CDS.1 [Saccharomyces cerevisiae]CAI6473130.1 AKR_HP2_G0023560.mRNA.1.CDS.1 [Saccharomyces cerevisiae]
MKEKSNLNADNTTANKINKQVRISKKGKVDALNNRCAKFSPMKPLKDTPNYFIKNFSHFRDHYLFNSIIFCTLSAILIRSKLNSESLNNLNIEEFCQALTNPLTRICS